MTLVPLRLGPGADLRLALEAWMDQRQGRAGWVISGIGSLAVARIRLAGQDGITTFDGDLELLSLAGSLGPDGAHLHLAIADDQDVVERDGRTGFTGQFLDADQVVGDDPVLFAAGADNCEHLS